jgi:hypothetical protein
MNETSLPPRNLILLPLLHITSRPHLSDTTTQRPGTGVSTARTSWRDLHTPQITTTDRARLVKWLLTSTANNYHIDYHILSTGTCRETPRNYRQVIAASTYSTYTRVRFADRSNTLLDLCYSTTRPRVSQLPYLKPKPSYSCLSDHCDQRVCCEPLGSKHPVNPLDRQSPAEHQAIRYPFRRSLAWRTTDCLH